MNSKTIVVGLFLCSLLLTNCATGQSTNAPTTTTPPTSSVLTSEAATAPITASATITTAEGATMTISQTDDATPQVVAAANAFLATLSDSEKATTLFDWTDTAQKQRWSNFPDGAFDRAGLMWGDMSEAQKNAWLAVMQATLRNCLKSESCQLTR